MSLFKIVFLPAVFLLASSAFAEEKLIGLIEIPRIFGTRSPEGLPGAIPSEKERVLLYAEPQEKSKVATKASYKDIESREHDYEELSAAAYAEKKRLVSN